MYRYKHIFFDLDRTLWDFDRNSGETLNELFFKYHLDRSIDDPQDFIRVYHEINLQLWSLYRKGEMTKDILRIKRFRLSLSHFGISDDALATHIGDDYLDISPTKTLLVPHALEILSYLHSNYQLHCLTNGFQTTQQIKMRNCQLEQYFKSLTTSELVGHNKPRAEIFHHALSSVNAHKKESLMIGDDLEVDILGARNFGIDQVFLNRDNVIHNDPVTYEIDSLLELKDIL
ncbi:MAG: YjjG family noncanonical pyrimidine nucleotidase [Bacteroidales bacterium]|nr:YjjG family noncanonical pyrimidine nucleotidase [Bacteroidales bacterium]